MKQISEMSCEEMRTEIQVFCNKLSRSGSCGTCVLSGINRLGDVNSYHKGPSAIEDRYTLGLMVALIRGYLVWDESRLNQNDRKEFDNGSNVPDQPTVPPMPEPVKSVVSQVTELTESVEGNLLIDGYADATQIVISGKKPTSVTLYYDQEGGGDS